MLRNIPLFLFTSTLVFSLLINNVFAQVYTQGTSLLDTDTKSYTQTGIGTHNTNEDNYSSYKILESLESAVTNTECMGDYHPILPSTSILNTNVYSAELFSPIKLGDDWVVLDHIGSKDAAYTGERHIVLRDNNGDIGIQWYGYEKDPCNDLILKDLDTNWNRINVQQCPVRADWHTVNGSGIVFGATTSASAGDFKAVYNKSYDGDSNTLTCYAFVATVNTIELRKYDQVSFKDFSDGGKGNIIYTVITSVPKECNSQSLSIDRTGDIYKFYVGNKCCFVLSEEQLGISDKNYVGAMVDYQLHNCTSLSSMYMFNLTVDGVDLFKEGLSSDE